MSQSFDSLCGTRPVFFIRNLVTGCKIRNVDWRRVGAEGVYHGSAYRQATDAATVLTACMIGLCATMHIGTFGALRPHTQIISSSAASRYQNQEGSTMVAEIACLGKSHRSAWLKSKLTITQSRTGSGNSHEIGVGQPAYHEASSFPKHIGPWISCRYCRLLITASEADS